MTVSNGLIFLEMLETGNYRLIDLSKDFKGMYFVPGLSLFSSLDMPGPRVDVL